MFKCQELSPEAQVRKIHSECKQTQVSLGLHPKAGDGVKLTASLLHTQKNPKWCCEITPQPPWRKLVKIEAQSVAGGFVK